MVSDRTDQTEMESVIYVIVALYITLFKPQKTNVLLKDAQYTIFYGKLCEWRGRILNILSCSRAMQTNGEWYRQCAYSHRKQCVHILKMWRGATWRCTFCLVCDPL